MTIGNKQSVVKLWGYRNDVTMYGQYVYDALWNPTVWNHMGKRWVGEDNPNYQMLIKQGLVATNNYSSNFGKVIHAEPGSIYATTDGSSGFIDGYYRQVNYTHFGSHHSEPLWDNSLISSMTNACMGKMYNKIDSLNRKVGGFEFLGEFRDTLHLIKHPAESLAAYANKKATAHLTKVIKSRRRIAWLNDNPKNYYRSKKFHFVRPKPSMLKRVKYEEKQLRRLISRSWLEFNFGAAPLIQELQAAADAAVETFPDKGSTKILRSTTTEQRETTVLGPRTGAGVVVYQEEITSVWEYRVTLVARVKYDGRYDGMSELQQLASRSGFTLRNLIPAAWELAPLSVFFDYFANVGTVLSAFATETRGVTVDRYVKRRLLRRTSVVFEVPARAQYAEVNPGNIVTYYTQYDRERWVMSIPTFTFTNPLSSVAKMANLAAFIGILTS